MTDDEWNDPPTDDSHPTDKPLVRGAMQVVVGVVIFVALGTLVFGDSLQASATQGLLFGVAYAVLYAVFQYFKS